MPLPPALPADAIHLDRDALIRVEAPAHPDAVARSATGAVLLAPPDDGTPWSREAVPWTDQIVADEVEGPINLAPWHARGARGAGVRVAVFDLQWERTAQLDPDLDVTTHDCWDSQACARPMDPLRTRFAFERGPHGTACAEVVGAIAPEAELHLVRVNSRTTLENAVEWAIREEIHVISMSLSWFNQTFFDGGGPIDPLMDRLAAHDILVVTSAGNYARGHWRGHWTDVDGDQRLDFDGDNQLEVRLEPGQRTYITWDQYGICGATDLDVRLLDAAGRIVDRSEALQAPPDLAPDGARCAPIEQVDAGETEGPFQLEVRRRRGTTVDVLVDVLTPGGRIPGGVAGGSIVDPGLHPAVLTVGAASPVDYLSPEVRSYSSRGPSLTGLIKPDLVAPDGLTTRSLGTGGFFGTSAATPVVAGMVAVVLSDAPHLTPHQAAARLEAWAWDPGPPGGGPDPRWGVGKARLPVEGEAPGCGRGPVVLLPLLLPVALLGGRRRAR